MTATPFNAELRAPSRGRHARERRDARAIDFVAAASHPAMIISRFILTIALLAIIAAGTIALKTAIWIPHFL
jgi:hypothetical protein